MLQNALSLVTIDALLLLTLDAATSQLTPNPTPTPKSDPPTSSLPHMKSILPTFPLTSLSPPNLFSSIIFSLFSFLQIVPSDVAVAGLIHDVNIPDSDRDAAKLLLIRDGAELPARRNMCSLSSYLSYHIDKKEKEEQNRRKNREKKRGKGE